MKMDRTKIVSLGGLALIVIIWIISALTAKDALWAGKAIALSAPVLLIVALVNLVNEKQ